MIYDSSRRHILYNLQELLKSDLLINQDYWAYLIFIFIDLQTQVCGTATSGTWLKNRTTATSVQITF